MAEQVTFETGYARLQEIAQRLDENPTVHETCELFREGKGLEKALREYLKEREGELAEIEAGSNLPAFEIVAPTGTSTSTDADDDAKPSESRPTDVGSDAPPAIKPAGDGDLF